MEDLNMLLTLIITGVTLLGTLIGVGIKLWGALKIIAKNKDWKKIMKIADVAMKQAEASGKAGAEKKQMVIDIVEASCAELGIVIDINEVVKYVEESIAFVNSLTKK
jgi:hypothetical protein